MRRAQWEALEADLIPMGYTLEDIPRRLNWRALRAWQKMAPQSSNYYQLEHGEPAKWGDSDYMLALACDYLALLAWMKTKDGVANRKRPDPLPRPGVKPKTTRMGNRRLTIAQAKEWLGW